MSAFPKISFIPIVLLLFSAARAAARDPHTIQFRSANLFPESATWDPAGQHFIVGSLRQRSFHAVSDAGVVTTLLSDPSLPPDATILGLAVDTVRRRLLAAVTSPPDSDRPFNALAAYDLRSLTPLYLSLLPSDPTSKATDVANGVAVDFDGNAFVTNSRNNFIWKVDAAGEASIFSRSTLFTKHAPLDPNSPYADSGLNGIHYISKGYLLVVQSNTGKLFKVDAVDGTARLVILDEDLALAHGIVLRSDGAAVVVSAVNGGWVVKSDDSFSEGRVVEKIQIQNGGFPTAVVVGGGGRVYLLYGHVDEGMMGNSEREWFRLEEVGGREENENVWVFVLLGLGLLYFFIWRFQMSQLVKNMDKKTQ